MTHAALEGETVLITGGAVRLGAAMAKALAGAGARIIVHYRENYDAAEALIESLPTHKAGHRSMCADLLDEASCDGLIQGLVEAGLKPTTLINNASTYVRRPLATTTRATLADDYTINFTVPFMLMNQFHALCQQGHIINMLDQRVDRVDPDAGAYAFAKKSLRDLTEATAISWAPHIRVNAIAPGTILPPPGQDASAIANTLTDIPMGQATPLQDIGNAALFLCQTPNANGQTIYVDGGVHLK